MPRPTGAADDVVTAGRSTACGICWIIGAGSGVIGRRADAADDTVA